MEWTEAQRRACELLAIDDETDAAIAAAVQVSRRTLARWKRLPDFAQRLAAKRAARCQEILGELAPRHEAHVAQERRRYAAETARWEADLEAMIRRGRYRALEEPQAPTTCGARCRDGHACRRRPEKGRGRCRLHGGLSTGPTTEAGKQAIRQSNARRAQQARRRPMAGADPAPLAQPDRLPTVQVGLCAS